MIKIRPFHLLLVCVALTALGLRLLWGLNLHVVTHTGADEFMVYANSMLRWGIYARDFDHPLPTSMRMPLYPIIMAVVRIFSGADQWINWITAIQYVLGALFCALLAAFTAELTDEVVGTVAGFLAAFYIDYVLTAVALLRENVSLVLLMAGLLFLIRFLKGRSSVNVYASAAFLGVSLLSRPESALLAGLILFFERKQLFLRLREEGTHKILLGIFALLPWSIWVIRNGMVHGHFIPFSTDGAWVFFMGQVYSPQDAYTLADPAAMKVITSTPIEYDWYRQLNHEALSALLHHPWRNAKWVVDKFFETFQEYFHDDFMSSFWTLSLVLVPFFAAKRSRYARTMRILAVAVGALLFMVGTYDRSRPLLLLRIRFTDLILIGPIGLAAMIVGGRARYWKLLAASFLTLLASLALFIAHLRNRVMLGDWLLIIGAAYAIVEVVRRIDILSVGKTMEPSRIP